MADDMSDLIGKLGDMLNSNNMPDNIKDIVSNLASSNSTGRATALTLQMAMTIMHLILVLK